MNKILVGIIVATCSTVAYMVGVSRTYTTVKKEFSRVLTDIEKEIQKRSQEEILEQEIED